MKKEYDMSGAQRGAVIPLKGKTRITIYISDEVLDEFRQRAETAGVSYQPMIDAALREYLDRTREPLETTLRRVIREELRAAG